MISYLISDYVKVLNLYLHLKIKSEYIFFENEAVLCLVSQKHIITTQSSVVRRWFLLETVKLTQTVITDFNFNWLWQECQSVCCLLWKDKICLWTIQKGVSKSHCTLLVFSLKLPVSKNLSNQMGIKYSFSIAILAKIDISNSILDHLA